MDKKFDIIIYGATGFTGSLGAKYMDKYSNEFKWAIAGRDSNKLEKLQNEIPGKPEIVIADANDEQALIKLTASTKVVASYAGPFNKYSNLLVKACVETGTHYVDITGEAIWVRDLIDNYHQRCIDNKIKIIPACGYDSIPSDLGTYFTAKQVNEPLKSIFAYHNMSGGVSGGTIESAFTMRDFKSKHKMGHPFLLNPEGSYSKNQKLLSKDYFSIKKNKKLNKWVIPFVMAITNTRPVRRSAALMEAKQQSYGPDFVYNEFQMVNKYSVALITTVSLAVLGMIIVSPFRNFLRKFFPKPGTGPNEKTRNNGWYEALFVAKTTKNQEYVYRMYGKGDPGYKSTSMFLVESAISLLNNSDIGEYGVLTPATGLGDDLIIRLKDQGVLFEGPINR
ncbi:MAG: saccharopine dehydrogenase NADP-binding domain-containing protein [Pelagibacterales bacterium]|nr:saccharopine dehydrogenase NADP-binding domain-containing protein [Pelagibacterales bacterium]